MDDQTDDATDRPSLEQLREELNDQFESIRVLEPGQYELNLMELYNREEYIIALQEDGKYTIQVPERWKDE
jgi:predicted  nucleic acid-binding Zn-ribbon protein